MSYSKIQIGRLSLTELPQNGGVETVSQGAQQPPQRLLRIIGQEGFPINGTQASLAALHDDIQGLATGYYLVPVTFGDKSDRNAYYRVYAAQNTELDWSANEAVSDSWQIDLERVGSELEIDLESRLTGPATVNNSFSWASSESLFSPPSGAYALNPGASPITRPCADGPDQSVYVALGAPNSARWGCSLANYGNGRCRFLDDQGIERSGINFSPASLTTWTMSNGIVQVTPGTAGNTLTVQHWSGAPAAGGARSWQNRGWDLTNAGTQLSGWSSVNLLRNDYEMLVVRLVKDVPSQGRVLIDLTLRRGSRFVEVYIASGFSSTWKLVRHNSEAGTLGGLGNAALTANVDNSAGNQYTIGSAHTFTADTTNGGISATGTTFDAYIGAVVATDVLNANPDFETNVSNWTPTGGTFAPSNTRAHNGSFSALMTPNGVAAQVFAESEQIPVVANATYQASAWVWPTSTTANIGVSVNWYDATHTFISATSNTASATGAQWNFLTSHTNTAPSNAAFAEVIPIIGGTPAAGQLLWWDEVKLRAYTYPSGNLTPGQSGSLSTDLLGQYAGRRGEYVQPVRR